MGEFWALLVNVRVAVAAPVVCGLNVAEKDTLWPEGMVTGKVSPPKLNVALFVPADVTVTLPPVAVKDPEADPLVPSTTLPIARVDGETPSCPAAALPVPESGMLSVGFDALELTVTVPVALAAELGLNLT